MNKELLPQHRRHSASSTECPPEKAAALLLSTSGGDEQVSVWLTLTPGGLEVRVVLRRLRKKAVLT